MTSTDEALKNALKRPALYTVIDGIPQIVLGSLWLLWAAIVLLPAYYPHVIAPQARVFLLLMSMLVLPLAMKRLIRSWKERVTYPRTGYIELRHRWTRTALIAISGAAMGAVWGQLVVRGTALKPWLPLVLGVGMSIGFLYWAIRVGSKRLGVMCWITTGLGLILSLQRVPFTEATGWILLASGVVSVGDGLLVMREYLAAHPLAAESGHE